ncbi:MAG: molecular chaperone TorD family protein [Candidatus Binatia bacterium]
MNETPTIEDISSEAEKHAAARSTLYKHLAAWLRFPWEEFHVSARAGELEPAARECLALLPYGVDGAEAFLTGLAEVEPDYDEFQSAYVGLFDVGAGGPPCALYGGVWGGDRQKVMEEALRFYRFFGLTISSQERDLPDQLCTELEFLHFLTFKELEALRDGGDVGSLRRASRDFLLRHPGRWLPKALKKLEGLDPPPFWHGLLGLAAAYCRADSDYLVGTEGPAKD